MRTDGNLSSTLHYQPNSYDEWQDNPEVKEPALDIFGNADHWNFREDDDLYYEQPGKLFRLMTDEQKEVLFNNTARDFHDAEEFIDRKSTRLNSSHVSISYAVFCLKNKNHK